MVVGAQGGRNFYQGTSALWKGKRTGRQVWCRRFSSTNGYINFHKRNNFLKLAGQNQKFFSPIYNDSCLVTKMNDWTYEKCFNYIWRTIMNNNKYWWFRNNISKYLNNDSFFNAINYITMSNYKFAHTHITLIFKPAMIWENIYVGGNHTMNQLQWLHMNTKKYT